MAAGLTTLRILEREKAWTKLETIGAHLEKEVAANLQGLDLTWTLTRIGSLLWMSFQKGDAPRSAEAIDEGAGARFKPLFHALLERGIYVPPSAYEVMFLSLAHKPEEMTLFAKALREAVVATAG
jgi:glutamate-1-semialdehyde 2,1-aminomutase